ncbi:MAG TPA: O-antigen polymerase [Parafilimonas sp.]|nr:O-antigen polymerase [Parafilimonas sp.]
MNRINYYSILIRVHVLLMAITLLGSLYVIVIGAYDYLIAFLTIPLVNILLLPITKKDEKFDPTHPILMILVSLMIGTVLRSFFIFSPLQSDAKFLMLMGKPPSVLMTGIFAIYLGIICFVVGYVYPVKPLKDWSRIGVFSNKVSLKKYYPVAIVLALISVFAAVTYFKKVGVNFSDINGISQKRRYKVDDQGGGYAVLGYYRLCMDIIEPVYYVGLMYILTSKKRIFSILGLFVFMLGLLCLIYPFINSSRTNALYVLINSGLIIYFIKGGIQWRQLFSVLAIASLVLVIMTALRQEHSQKRSQTELEANPLVIMVGSLNFLGVDKTSHIIAGVPDKLYYQFGESFFLWMVAPIPRTMWREKPDISYGLVIGDKIYDKREPDSAGGGVPPGYIAELYINFGYVGIVAGMFLLGMVLKLFYNAFRKSRDTSTYSMLLYILVFIPFSLKLIGGDASGCIVKVFSGILTITLITKLIEIKSSGAANTRV